MSGLPRLRRMTLHGAIYGVAAAMSIKLGLASGGFAMLWIATAVLVAWLLPRHPSQWWPTLLGCAIASMAATATVGIGWKAAPLLALANCLEAVVDALLVRRAYRRHGGFSSLHSTVTTYVACMIAGPLASVVPAVVGAAIALDRPLGGLALEWFMAHALGFVSVFPCAGLIMLSRVQHRTLLPAPGKRLLSAVALGAIVLSGLIGFGQSAAPMLFLPVLVLMYTIVLADLSVAAAGLALLVTMGVASAYFGTGPFQLVGAGPTDRFLFVQFYSACVSLSAMPLATLLDRRRRLFSALAESETRYRLLADSSTDIIMVTSADGEIRYVSPSIRQLGDWEPAQLIGSGSDALVAKQHRDEVAQAYLGVVRDPGSTGSVEFLGVTRDGHARWFESQMRAILDETGSVDGVCSVVRDISRRKRKEAELKSVALTDPLTSLANRRAFEMFLGHGRSPGEGFLALFDLDRLKRVNREFGRDCGDLVLQCFARAMRGTVRHNDLAARLEGGTFVVHFDDTSLAQAKLICERLSELFRQELRQRLPDIDPVTASVGISRLDGPLPAALARAEAALRQAKAGEAESLASAA